MSAAHARTEFVWLISEAQVRASFSPDISVLHSPTGFVEAMTLSPTAGKQLCRK